MAEEQKESKSFWQTFPGILTAAAGIITAATGLIVALNQAGILNGGKNEPAVNHATTKSLKPVGSNPVLPGHDIAAQAPTTPTQQSDQPVNSTAADAASTNIDKPTWLTANEIRGVGVGESTSYYYSLNAGPGVVKVTLDGKNKLSGYTFGTRVELMDMDAKRLLSLQTGNTTLGKRVIERLQLGRQQQIIMRVLLDEDAIDYMVRLEGAVDFSPTTKNVASP